MTIEEFIIIISEELNIRSGDISLTSHLYYDLGVDSMSLVSIVTSVEQLLGKELENLEFENIETVKQAYEYLIKLSCHESVC